MAIDPRSPEFEACIVSVWKQALLESAKRVTVGSDSYSVRRTAKNKLAQVDFEFHGEPIRGLEQNPKTQSRWAQLARKGEKVMQFLQGGRYVAVVHGAKIFTYK
ncbi:MAG TPA: hypothetical protein VGJ06_14885 [Candidatus Acidoferrum sp.]|jgi:NADPH-dependent ferric siderophore reductase